MATGFILQAFRIDGTLICEKRFSGLPVRIGRNPLNDFSVSEAAIARVLSSFHARIEPLESRIMIRDLGSKNGVYVRDASGQTHRVAPDRPADLGAHGFEFFLGPQLRLTVQIAELGSALPRDAAPGEVLPMRAIRPQPEATHAIRRSDLDGANGDSWDAGWDAARHRKFVMALEATPAQRLLWLEQMIHLAHLAGALPRPPKR